MIGLLSEIGALTERNLRNLYFLIQLVFLPLQGCSFNQKNDDLVLTCKQV